MGQGVRNTRLDMKSNSQTALARGILQPLHAALAGERVHFYACAPCDSKRSSCSTQDTI